MKALKNLSIVAMCLLLVAVAGCKKQDSPEPAGNGTSTNNPTVPPNSYNPPSVTFSAPVMGLVTDENGNAIAGATVSSGAKTFVTDAHGAFEFASLPFTGNFCYVKATKKGYFTGSTTIHGKAGSKYSAIIVLPTQSNIQTFLATQGKTINVGNNASVTFPANAIKTLDGKPYTGNVNVAAMHINPSAANFRNLVPGGDLRAYNAQGKDVQLYSYGMLNVELRDDAGNYLQLGGGQKATFSMDVPQNMQLAPPSTIPLWYFDENKGVWIEEGDAKLLNGKYVGTVTHFTPWNCDYQGPRATIKGKVRDCEGEVVRSVMVTIEQVNIYIDDDGNWEQWVPADYDLALNIYVPSMDEYILVNKALPKLKDGEVYDAGTITIPCRNKIKGDITDCNGNPFTGYVLIDDNSGKQVWSQVIDGKLMLFYGGTNATADIYFYQAAGGQLYKYTTQLNFTQTKKIDLGTIQACNTSVAYKFEFDYNDGTTTKTVKFNAITNAIGIYNTQMDRMFIEIGDHDTIRNDSSYRSAFIVLNSPVVSQTTIGDSMGIYMYSEGLSFSSNGKLSVTIDKYSGVSGQVSGTFSGDMDMMDYYGGSKTPIPVTVSNGKFSVIRFPDQK